MDWGKIEEKIIQLEIFDAIADPKELLAIANRLKRVQHNYHTWSTLFGRIASSVLDMNNEERASLTLVNVLYEIEGPLSQCVNLVIYVLKSKEHHDLWSEYKQDFVTSFNDVQELPLHVKEKFLRRHELGFLSKLCHRELRNAIAHQNFVIDSDGSVYVQNGGKKARRYSTEDLIEIIRQSGKLVNIIQESVERTISKIEKNLDEGI